MPWQKIDDQFGVHRKVIRIPRKLRLEAVGLWTLALNYAGRNTTNGVLEEHELEEVLARAAIVNELVRVELWHSAGYVCGSDKCGDPAPDGGITIHDFLVYNPSRTEVVQAREAERVRKESWRLSRKSPAGTTTGHDPVSEHPVPVPDPVPHDLTDMTPPGFSSPDPNVRAKGLDPLQDLIHEKEELAADRAAILGIRNPTAAHKRIQSALKLRITLLTAIDLAAVILDKAKTDVIDPDAYLARACQKPDEICQHFANLDAEALV